MIKKLIAFAALIVLFAGSAAAQDYVPAPENIAAREQFSHDRFGIFIHWGIYSMLGSGEWVLQNQKLTQDEYSRLAAGFCPSPDRLKSQLFNSLRVRFSHSLCILGRSPSNTRFSASCS